MPFENTVKTASKHNGCYYPAPPGWTSHRTETEFRSVRYTLDKEQRPKPPEPLWMYPTPRAKQYHTKIWYRKERRTYPTTLNIIENGKYVKYPVTYIKEWWGDINTYGIGTASPTNWETKARTKIKSELVNIGESLAEYRETAKLFRQTGEILFDIYRTLRKGRVPVRLQRRYQQWSGKQTKTYLEMPWRLRNRLTPDAIPTMYLIGEWGIKPLISDLQASVEVLDGRVQLPIFRRLYVHATSGNKTRGWHRSDRATFYMKLDPDRGNFTAGNLLELGWELTPFSFMIDRLIPIGEWLSTLDALKSVTWMTGSVTRKEQVRFWRDEIINPGYTIVEKGLYLQKSHQRFVHSTIPMAPPPLRWEPSKSWRHVAQGLALLYLLRGYGKTK